MKHQAFSKVQQESGNHGAWTLTKGPSFVSGTQWWAYLSPWDIDMKSLLLALPSTLMNSSLHSISTMFNAITLEILVTGNGLFLLHTGAERVQWSCVLPVHLGSTDSGSSERRCAEYCSVSYSTTRCTLQEHPVWSYSLGGSALQSPKLLESHQMPCS